MQWQDKKVRIHYAAVAAGLLLSACSKAPSTVQNSTEKFNDHRDDHSYSRPEEARVRHIALDLDVLFPREILQGRQRWCSIGIRATNPYALIRGI